LILSYQKDKLIDMEASLNPLQLKTFNKAYEVLNFTQTAKILGLTQSGVSQHIAQLEETLTKPLFKRVGKKVFHTETAHQLYTYSKTILYQMDDFIQSIKQNEEDMSVHFSIAAPGGFGNYLLNLILKYQVKNPQTTSKVEYAPNENIYKHLLSGFSDFGFVYEVPKIKHLLYEKLFDEEMVLVSKYNQTIYCKTRKQILANKFIDHPNGDIQKRSWLEYNFEDGAEIYSKLNYNGYVNNLRSILDYVESGVGICVLPFHSVKECVENKTISVHHVAKRKKFKKPMYMVYRKEQLSSRKYLELKKILTM
jgi:DNA-binding transcriptional LysR family regulator